MSLTTRFLVAFATLTMWSAASISKDLEKAEPASVGMSAAGLAKLSVDMSRKTSSCSNKAAISAI